MLDRHHHVVREPQAPQARHRRGRREAQLDHLGPVRRDDLARDPLRTRRKAAPPQHLRKARQLRERIFEPRRDETAGALRAADQALLDEQRDRLARGDARYAKRLGSTRARTAAPPPPTTRRPGSPRQALRASWQIQGRHAVGIGFQLLPARFHRTSVGSGVLLLFAGHYRTKVIPVNFVKNIIQLS